MTSRLRVWDLDYLAGLDDLTEPLVRADNDHHLDTPAMLLIRSETAAWRQVQVTTLTEGEAVVAIHPATRAPSVKHPLGRAPMDTVIGPVVGLVTYLPSTRGLRVLAFTPPGKDH
jgi:hypothetical protein